MSRKARQYLLLGLVIVSVALAFLSPLEETKQEIIDHLPWVLLGLAITEAMFILGLIVIATGVGVRLKGNPLKWRNQLMPMLRESAKTPVFWIGFWINTIGALGSGVVVGIGVVLTLPPQSWGLVIFPFSDLTLTVAVRAAAIGVINDREDVPNGAE